MIPRLVFVPDTDAHTLHPCCMFFPPSLTCHAVILINPDLTDKVSAAGQQSVRGRQQRIDFANSFETVYHFQNIYVSGTSYFPILGATTKLHPTEQWYVSLLANVVLVVVQQCRLACVVTDVCGFRLVCFRRDCNLCTPATLSIGSVINDEITPMTVGKSMSPSCPAKPSLLAKTFWNRLTGKNNCSYSEALLRPMDNEQISENMYCLLVDTLDMYFIKNWNKEVCSFFLCYHFYWIISFAAAKIRRSIW